MPRYFGKPCPECPYGKVLAPLPEDRIGYLADFPDMLVEQMPYIRTGLNMRNFEPCSYPDSAERTAGICIMEAIPSIAQRLIFLYALATPFIILEWPYFTMISNRLKFFPLKMPVISSVFTFFSLQQLDSSDMCSRFQILLCYLTLS